MKYFIKKSIFAAALFSALFASGASAPKPGELSLVVSPQYPSAGENFKVSARTFSFDPLQANFRWTLNGQVVASGRGISEHEFTASSLGSTMNIGVRATLSNGLSYELSAPIQIADVDLIIRPATYTPLFYRGAALATPGSAVEIYAVPHLFSGNSRLAAGSLIYEWFVDEKKYNSDSGLGKNKLIVEFPEFISRSEIEIKLKISSLNRNISNEKTFRISTSQPQVLFYTVNNLTGKFPIARSNFLVSAGSSISVLAEPYYFDITSIGQAKITWSANGAVVGSDSGNPRVLTVSAPENSISSANFGFLIENKKSVFKRAESILTITSTQ